MTQPLFAVTAALTPKEPKADCFRPNYCKQGSLTGDAFSLRGLSHVSGDEPLQDSCALSALPNGWLIAAVADGVGSEARSEVGSAIAAEAVTSFCARFWGRDASQQAVIALLRSAYHHAYGCLALRAQRDNRPLHEYGTTLHTAVFTGEKVYFGHAGDGGMLVMDGKGMLLNCTEPQKGPDGESVVTLLAGPESWQFGVVEDVVSVLLLTDGVYDKLASKALKRFWNGVDCNLAAFFLSPWALSAAGPEADRSEMIAAFRGATPNDFYPRIVRAVAQGGDEETAQTFVAEHVLQGNRPLRTLQGIRDDISVAVLRNLDRVPGRCDREYYLPPDWDAINRQISAQLYDLRETAHEPEAETAAETIEEVPTEATAEVEAEAMAEAQTEATPEAVAETTPEAAMETAADTNHEEAGESDADGQRA